MALLITTTGTPATVTLTDLGGLTLTHPVVDLDLQEPFGGFSVEVLRASLFNGSLLAAISGGQITVENSDGSAVTGLSNFNPEPVQSVVDSTGVKSGGNVTFTIGQTTFNVGATLGCISDATGDYAIDYPGETGKNVISTVVSSIWVYLDKNGTLLQQTTEPTEPEFRSKIFLTRLAFSGGTLRAQEQLINPIGNEVNHLRDFLGFIKSPKRGFDLTGNANLTFNHAAGEIFELGGNYGVDNDSPNIKSLPAVTNATFFYVTRNSTLSTAATAIEPDSIDLNGVQTLMSNNRFKIETVYKFNSGSIVIQRGQNQYTSLDAARSAITTRDFVLNPILENGTRLGWIIIQRGATSLQNPVSSLIVQDTSFGSGNTASTGIARGTAADFDLTYFNGSVLDASPNVRINSGNLNVLSTYQVNGQALSLRHLGDVADTLTTSNRSILVHNGTEWVSEQRAIIRVGTSGSGDSSINYNNVTPLTVTFSGAPLIVGNPALFTNANGTITCNFTGTVEVNYVIPLFATQGERVQLEGTIRLNGAAVSPITYSYIRNTNNLGTNAVYDAVTGYDVVSVTSGDIISVALVRAPTSPSNFTCTIPALATIIVKRI